MDEDLDRVLIFSVLDANRNALLNTKSYAAAQNLCDSVTWIDDGPDIRLVWKTDVSDTLNVADVPNAHLSMIVHITEDDCFIMADSAWQGPSEIAPTFADIMLTCTGSAPPFLGVYSDFFEIVNNLSQIIRMTDDRAPTSRGLMTGEYRDWKIMLQHKPFLVGYLRVYRMGY